VVIGVGEVVILYVVMVAAVNYTPNHGITPPSSSLLLYLLSVYYNRSKQLICD